MSPEPAVDQSLRYARREATFVLILWAIAALWTLGYCYLRGYGPAPDGIDAPTPFGLGIPEWAFWGILVPWSICILISVWYALYRMPDEPDSERNEVGS